MVFYSSSSSTSSYSFFFFFFLHSSHSFVPIIIIKIIITTTTRNDREGILYLILFIVILRFLYAQDKNFFCLWVFERKKFLLAHFIHLFFSDVLNGYMWKFMYLHHIRCAQFCCFWDLSHSLNEANNITNSQKFIVSHTKYSASKRHNFNIVNEWTCPRGGIISLFNKFLIFFFSSLFILGKSIIRQ